MPVITVRNLTKVYKMGDIEVRALRGVSLDIEQGEFVAVSGPSGSGKSKLMHIAGCLDITGNEQPRFESEHAAIVNINHPRELLREESACVGMHFVFLGAAFLRKAEENYKHVDKDKSFHHSEKTFLRPVRLHKTSRIRWVKAGLL